MMVYYLNHVAKVIERKISYNQIILTIRIIHNSGLKFYNSNFDVYEHAVTYLTTEEEIQILLSL